MNKREVKRETRRVGGDVETKNEEGKREASERGTEEAEDGDQLSLRGGTWTAWNERG